MGEQGLRAIVADRLRALAATPARFPVPLACAVLWAGVTVLRNHYAVSTRLGLDRVTAEQLQVLLLLGLFATLAVKLIAESRAWRASVSLPLSATVLGLLALAVFLEPWPGDMFDSAAFLFMGPGLVLLVIVAPFLRRGVESGSIWAFNFGSWTSAAFGLLVAIVLGLGMAALLGALEELFGLYVPNDLYGDIWIVCFSVIWPWQALSGAPRAGEAGRFEPAAQDACPRWFVYLISWLLVPIALAYLLVLYAFAVKIALQWALPEGGIGWLVAGFAGVGVAVWHAAHPLRDSGNRLVRAYVRWLHPALLVPAALLALGLGVRVAEYGVTENRYGLIVLTAWLAGVALHGLVVRAPRLSVAPLSFAVLLILAGFGPWGATAVSISSQIGRLDALLVEAGVLRDEALSKPVESIPSELAARISRVVDYLNQRGRQEALYGRLRDGGIAIDAPSGSSDVVSAMGIDYRSNWRDERFPAWSVYGPSTMDARGYDFMLRTELVPGDEDRWSAAIGDPATELLTRVAGELLEFSIADHGPVAIDIAQIVAALDRDGVRGLDAINAPLMTVEAEHDGLKVRVHFTSIVVRVSPAAGVMELQRVSFEALVGVSGDG